MGFYSKWYRFDLRKERNKGVYTRNSDTPLFSRRSLTRGKTSTNSKIFVADFLWKSVGFCIFPISFRTFCYKFPYMGPFKGGPIYTRFFNTWIFQKSVLLTKWVGNQRFWLLTIDFAIKKIRSTWKNHSWTPKSPKKMFPEILKFCKIHVLKT